MFHMMTWTTLSFVDLELFSLLSSLCARIVLLVGARFHDIWPTAFIYKEVYWICQPSWDWYLSYFQDEWWGQGNSLLMKAVDCPKVWHCYPWGTCARLKESPCPFFEFGFIFFFMHWGRRLSSYTFLQSSSWDKMSPTLMCLNMFHIRIFILCLPYSC